MSEYRLVMAGVVVLVAFAPLTIVWPMLDAILCAEPVKRGETTFYADSMSVSVLGSLIHATVGSFGG